METRERCIEHDGRILEICRNCPEVIGYEREASPLAMARNKIEALEASLEVRTELDAQTITRQAEEIEFKDIYIKRLEAHVALESNPETVSYIKEFAEDDIEDARQQKETHHE